MIIIFIFLRNLRATIIPGLAIPTSIVATFAIMYFLGFSINNFTLLALTLAIGIVVDDAIIVLENAYRHQEELGESPEDGGHQRHPRDRLRGASRPPSRWSRCSRRSPSSPARPGGCSTSSASRSAGSVVISGFVALTLTPMLCAKILRVPQRHGVLYRALENGLQRAWRPATPARSGWRSGTAGRGARRRGVRHRRRRGGLPVAQARVRAAGGQGLVLHLRHRARGLVAGLHRRIPAPGRGDRWARPRTSRATSAWSNIGDGVSRGMIFTNLDDWSKREALGAGHHQRGAAAVLRHPGRVRVRQQSAGLRVRAARCNFVIQHPDFDSLAQGQRHAAGAGAPDRRAW